MTIRNYCGFLVRSLGKCNIVEPGKVSPELSVPNHIVKPDYYYKFTPPGTSDGSSPEIKTFEDIQQMRETCKLAANILKSCQHIIKIGTTTDEIDRYVHQKIIDNNAYPSPLRYGGFPKSVCTSVNNVGCHGIPDDRPLMDGDIINVDITVFYKGYHGDCSTTFLVGNVDERGQFLVATTKACLTEAIKNCGPNVPFNRIGSVIERMAKKNQLNVIPAFVGHGIGRYFHGPPEILHYENDLFGTMLPGMVFTIEPLLTLGEQEIEILDDDWTAISTDGARSAQFEHTVLITESGVEVLTE
ncbi:Methionine aminopeptidase 1D, mitochondrial [Pseudolycoriella hygida]|uniref:Methionine aminopeptidase n=1 Tax=Pseudolycoriella hygida TaxID=35572 RepID=A0A9Q0N994_9DIPT|nr:Methionine aminopeptidase 1D, mitochondrial [Pseudolycoriella hygida]